MPTHASASVTGLGVGLPNAEPMTEISLLLAEYVIGARLDLTQTKPITRVDLTQAEPKSVQTHTFCRAIKKQSFWKC